jgi:hypothetical protein
VTRKSSIRALLGENVSKSRPLTMLQVRPACYAFQNPFWILAKDTVQEGQLRGIHGPVPQIALMAGTDVATYTRERPGVSAFVLEDGVVYPTYFAYSSRRGRPQGATRRRLVRVATCGPQLASLLVQKSV